MILFYFFALFLNAKEVKVLELTERQIHPLNLALGKTTLLRFDEKPQRLIIGNKNYFNVESNDLDIALQPLQKVETNLFVYTSKQTYSFNIRVCDNCNNDDFVKIVPKAISQSNIVSVEPSRFKEKNLSLSCRFKEFEIRMQKIKIKERTILFDFLVDAKKPVNLSDIKIQIRSSGKFLSDYQFAFAEKTKTLSLGRIHFSENPKKELAIVFSYGKQRHILKIERSYLL